MKKQSSGMNNSTGTLKRVFSVLVVLLLAATLMVGAGSAAGETPVSPDEPTEAAVWYVTVNGGTETKDGKSVETAFSSIQDAVSAAKDSDTILVADGTYEVVTDSGSLTIGKAVTLKASDETKKPYLKIAKNVVYGSPAQQVVLITTGGVTIDGFKIGNGEEDYKGIEVNPVVITEGAAALKPITITNCEINIENSIYLGNNGADTTCPIGVYTIEGNTIKDGSIVICNGAGNGMTEGQKATISGNTLTNVRLCINGITDAGWCKQDVNTLPEVTGNVWTPQLNSKFGSSAEQFMYVRQLQKEEAKLYDEATLKGIIEGNTIDGTTAISTVYSFSVEDSARRPYTNQNAAKGAIPRYLIVKPTGSETPVISDGTVAQAPSTVYGTETTVAANMYTLEGNTAVIEATADGTVTLKVTYADGTTLPSDTATAISGKATVIEADYQATPLNNLPGETENPTVALVIDLKTTATSLPQISGSIDSDMQTALANYGAAYDTFEVGPGFVAVFLNDAAHEYFNEQINAIELTFKVPKTWVTDSSKIQLVHISNDATPVVTPIDITNIDGTTDSDFWIVTATSSEGFSGYAIVMAAKAESTGGSPSGSPSSGSSTWLPSEPTATPTPTEQPTTPTDTVPTDIPSTQPTATPSTPGFGVLAVLAGLGAVAVLRRQ